MLNISQRQSNAMNNSQNLTNAVNISNIISNSNNNENNENHIGMNYGGNVEMLEPLMLEPENPLNNLVNLTPQPFTQTKTRFRPQSYQQSREQQMNQLRNSNQKVFILDSPDNHIRQILLEMGWIENKQVDSGLFDLKWKVSDLE